MPTPAAQLAVGKEVGEEEVEEITPGSATASMRSNTSFSAVTDTGLAHPREPGSPRGRAGRYVFLTEPVQGSFSGW